MELRGKSVVVVGLGRSGIAAAKLCLSRGAKVSGTDSRTLEEIGDSVRTLGVPLVLGGHDAAPFGDADVVVVSPGVPPFSALDKAARNGALVIGELDLAARFVKAPIVAVGGTNGKSTVTTATAALVAASGKRTFSGGNLGTPLAEAVDQPFDVLVVEVSSFQLERAPAFHPKVGVLLNVTEDHLDRYPSFDAYAAAKGNAFVNQTDDDVAVVPAGDRLCRREAERGDARVLTFGEKADYVVDGASVVERASGERFSLEGTDFHGTHNFSNAAASIAAARAIGVGAEAVRAGLREFRALGHRMALVSEVNGVRYYDDSKATNVGAAVTALRGLVEPRAVLVAGGRDKLGSYEPLVQALVEKARGVVVIGEAADRIASAVSGRVPVVFAKTMEDAVRRAQELAKPGDAVLLSPACASFDMFKGYADRGDRFVEAVKSLSPRSAS
ncbi:MAG TPA: UDP-N-acetylmuramoyl-L-alanine--D-glutamate ligase [Polyangiaceae bacterium]|nr:UDP-N-acetylmuramoyl-L-alanine--D-glutamate ligase [Polyangiaceae bacterium]